MIVLSRKKILLAISTLSIFIVTVTFMSSMITNPETVSTVNLPVSNKVIVIDAGHGVPDERSSKLKWYNRSGD